VLESYDRAPFYRELLRKKVELSSIAYNSRGDGVLVGAYDNSVTMAPTDGIPAVSLSSHRDTVWVPEILTDGFRKL